ncbi:MAG: ABC transporter ATP-binding protein [Thermoanaerobaculia bacterium]
MSNVVKRFDDVTALDGVSFSVEPGEIFGLVGPDGAGKTTVMRLLAAIMLPTAGEVRVLGRDTRHDPAKIQDDIAYMSQRFGLYPDLSVEENIQFYADLYGEAKKGREERIQRLLDFSNMGPFRKRRAGKLSGGMKQKLGLACALIHSPRVLLLDEPTNGVDPVSRRDFWRILNQLLAQGVTIVVTTAYLDEAERCSRLAMMHKGKIVALDTPEGMKRLLDGVVIEVRSNDSRRAAAILRERFGTSSVVLFGDRVNVVAPAAADATRAIETDLRDADLTLDEVRVVDPTLENVFVTLLGDDPKAREEAR